MTVGQLSRVIQQLRCLLDQGATEATDEALLESFLNQRDEAAFEALLRRHGRMVLGVCRRILGNDHDAEDAFQATFLILVRKAGSIRPKSMVGNWLYGVACRTALDARRAAAKRRVKEAAVLPRTQPPDQDRADLRAVLDEALQRLPPKCRAVIVLSDLEGKTRKEVALQLGWPEGSVASRLARARARLAKRLARYGLAVSGGSIGTLLPEGAASASVPPSLLVSTVRTATQLAAGQAAAGAIPAPVAALVQGALKAMLLNKVLKATVLLFVLVTLGTGMGLLLSHAGGTETVEREATLAGQTAFEAKAEVPAAEAGQEGKDEAKSELDRVQGTWRVVSSQVGDEKAAEDEVKRRKITVKGNVFTYDYGTGDPKRVGTLKLDPKTKYLDWNVTFPEAGTMLAIYEIKGDEWKIGFGNDGVVRPRRWVIGKNDVVWLLVLKREQPETKANGPLRPGDAGKDQTKAEKQALQGAWKLIRHEHKGRPRPIVEERHLIVEGDRYRMTTDGKTTVNGTFTLDPSQDPKWITTKVTDGPKDFQGKESQGIYQRQVDTLQWCMGERGRTERSKEFATKAGQPQFNYMVFKRVSRKEVAKIEALDHSNEAVFSMIHGDYDKAVAEATEAIRLDPENKLPYLNRGSAYALKGEPDKAIKDFDRVIQLDPKDVQGYDNRAAGYANKGGYRKAIEDYREAMRIGPEKYEPYAYLADLLATCPDPELRDGKKAVELATRACERTKWNDISSLSALAAAYAEVGDFKKAVEWQKKAMKATGSLVYKTKQQEEEDRQRLKSYEEGKPFRRQAASGTEKGAPNGDQKALQGTWRVVSIESEGVKSQVEGSYTLTFQKDQMHQLHKVTNGADFHYSFKLDSGKSPRTIDMTITKAGSEKDKGEVGKTLLGIYAVEGDSLKLCTDPKMRPTTLDTKGKGRDTVLMILKRGRK